MKPDLSVVILCYRTEESVSDFVKQVILQLNSFTDNWEIVLVGNYLKGTKDDTPLVVTQLAAQDQRIIALTKQKQGMMGWDARKGFEKATGDTIALIDGDGQVCVEDLAKIYHELKAKKYDMVKTFRVKRLDGFKRKVNSDIYNFLFRILFPGFTVRDVNSKPKIFTRDFYNKLELEADDWFLDAEIIIKARRYHCKLGEIPTIFYKVKGRKSFVRPRHILEFLKNLFLYRFKEFFVNK